MKKIVFIAAMAVVATAIVSMVSRSESYSLFEANVEVLAYSESDDEIVKCYCKTNWFSPNVCSANADGAYCGGNPCSNYDGNCR